MHERDEVRRIYEDFILFVLTSRRRVHLSSYPATKTSVFWQKLKIILKIHNYFGA
jgi:hypothetical protein